MIIKWYHNILDKHIEKYHSNEFVRKTKVREQIEEAVRNESSRVNTIRDEQERDKLESQAMDFFIILERHKAENRHLTREIKEFYQQRKDNSNLRYALIQRRDKLLHMAMRMKNEGDVLHENTNNFVGAIGAIYNEIVSDEEKENKQSSTERAITGM